MDFNYVSIFVDDFLKRAHFDRGRQIARDKERGRGREKNV